MLSFICMGPVDLLGARRKRQNTKWKKHLAQSGTLRSEVWFSTIRATRALLTVVLFKWPLNIQYIHWYKFENDEVERILSSKCTVLFYFFEREIWCRKSNRYSETPCTFIFSKYYAFCTYPGEFVFSWCQSPASFDNGQFISTLTVKWPYSDLLLQLVYKKFQ